MEKPSLGDVMRPAWVRARGRESVPEKKAEKNPDYTRNPIFLFKGRVQGYYDLKRPEYNENGETEREVGSYVLLGKDSEGNVVEVDLLKRFNPKGVRVFEKTGMDFQGGNCAPGEDGAERITMQEFGSSRAPHVLLHELRHTVQEDDERLNKKFYRSVYDADFESEGYYKLNNKSTARELENILSSIMTPEEAKHVIAPLIEQINEIDAVARDAWDAGASDEEKKRIMDLYPNGDTEVVEKVTVRDIMRIPTLMMERDAEYGAIVALRALKKEFGIDLLQTYSGETVELTEDSPLVTVRELRKMVHSLERIQDYMEKIGVPDGCLRTLKGTPKHEPIPMSEKNRQSIDEVKEGMAGKIFRSKMRREGIDPSDLNGKYFDEGVPDEPGWLGVHDEDAVPESEKTEEETLRELKEKLERAYDK